jgi:hypothetical protein
MTDYYESIILDTQNRTTGTSLSLPQWSINAIRFKRNDQFRLSIVCPYFQNINSSNNSITIDTVAYTITSGFYSSIPEAISAFNTAITAKGITISLNQTTGLVTIAHATTAFTLEASTLLGFTAQQTGSASYTATRAPFFAENIIAVCSNLASLFNRINIVNRLQPNHPPNYLFSELYPVNGASNYIICSEWFTVHNPIEISSIYIAFAHPSSLSPSSSYYSTVIHDWTVKFEVKGRR